MAYSRRRGYWVWRRPTSARAQRAAARRITFMHNEKERSVTRLWWFRRYFWPRWPMGRNGGQRRQNTKTSLAVDTRYMDLAFLLNPVDDRRSLSPTSRLSHATPGWPPKRRIDTAWNDLLSKRYKPYGNLARHEMPSRSKLLETALAPESVDWCATFLDVGFDANSIFNQICPLRKGRWRKEEEAYAIELVKMVHANRLPLKFRQSLRTFLAQKLHSDEMRVLKKVGNSDAFAFARQRGHADEVAVTRPTYENERSIEPLETLRRAFLRSVQLDAIVAAREHLD
ncbi:hypothetical protein SDRG_01842 [Saprolegnia diclina VS20]|uniref:Uncharacterized protein n=1 Tax=Saprolegnia diclina (strain VS20) TaxID=1156394 RepID=T0R1D5_SAPDV|nr:hypothetical protein SDRG_01842 [Saprolegnia diclina VS20]EQC40771.1 hypothetical protein SDRG_01842 [Saprolegnia diclina VS20]|eukprot:XP_008605615.1 hypothetical protein SDRG_01842 [Saprolegnia diclina VS20]